MDLLFDFSALALCDAFSFWVSYTASTQTGLFSTEDDQQLTAPRRLTVRVNRSDHRAGVTMRISISMSSLMPLVASITGFHLRPNALRRK